MSTMRPESMTRRQSGFGLVAAMFLIVVVALVIAAMARLSSAQHGTSSLAIQQARAYQAARSGLEWGITQAISAGSCAAGNPGLAGGNLSDFSVVVACNSTGYTDEQGTAITIFRFTATAQNGAPGGRPDYAYRQLTATVER
jgi:MSHA biogenesis protein MshP